MAKGMSVHIGLNAVDPNAYKLFEWRKGGENVVVVDEGDPDADPDPKNYRLIEIPDGQWFRMGWVGPLKSCELDAGDMRTIAEEAGFATKALLGEDATADNVIAELTRAAKALKSGDTFLLSYAGHGSQVDDLSGDEVDEVDETWCLYDRMLIDDERYVLLSKFRPGVRIVVIVDCCHSGTTMRSDEDQSPRRSQVRMKTRARMMPRDVAEAVYAGRKDEYDRIQESLPEVGEIAASVVTISACQDDELAGDGEKNGAFTGALKRVWKSAVDYRDLHKKIAAELETEYQEELAREGGDEEAVSRQTPSFDAFGGESGETALETLLSGKPFAL